MMIVTGFFTFTGWVVLTLGRMVVTFVVVVVTFGLVVDFAGFDDFLIFLEVFLMTGGPIFLPAGLFLFLLGSMLILPLCLLVVVSSWPAGWEVGEVLVLPLLPASPSSLGGTKTRVLSLPPSSLKV